MVSLSNEQRLIVRTAREIAENEFETTVSNRDGDVPWGNVESLAEVGLLGVNLPEEYGGGGLSEYETLLLIDVVGRVCPETAFFLHTQSLVAPRVVADFGTEAAKEKYLPPVLSGEDAIAIAVSEPEAGSDVFSMNSTVDRRDGEFVLNGEKIWVSNVHDSSAAVVWTKFDDDMGAVILDFDADGVEIAESYTNMADHEQTQFYMNDVVVPEENVLISGREGFRDLLRTLNWERLGNSMVSNTTAACALEHALDYAKTRTQFDQPIADFQGLEWRLSSMVTDLEVSRAMAYQTALEAREEGQYPDRMSASIAKLYAAQMVEEVASESLQLHGANGYQQGHPLEFLYRFARANRIAAGTDEMLLNLIASTLKEEGVPSVQ